MSDLAAALRRKGVVDVDESTITRAMYSTDASLYRVVPQVVVYPRHTDEIEAVLAVAREHGVALTMRGAGTSIAGNAVGTGIVVDTRRHLHHVLELDPESRTALVQPGAVHSVLQTKALRQGLRFGPDPSTHSRCTVGGMIGNNACGSRALGYGRTVDNVVALDVLTGSGERLTLDGSPTNGSTDLGRRLTAVVDGDLATVRREFGRFGRQVSGYSLEHLLPEHGRRLDRFLVGSEGTLALVLAARVALVEDAPHRALAVLGYPSMVEAADDVPGLLGHRLVACEGLDHRIVDVVVDRAGASAVPALPRGAGWIFAEVTGASESEVRDAAAAVAGASGALDQRVVTDPAEQQALWRIREDGAGLASRSLERPAHSGWEDAAVPPEQLGEYLRGFDALLEEYSYSGVPYGHFGEGCVHVRVDFELDGSDGGRARFRRFVEDAAALVARHGGTLSGEHGDGRARSELLPAMYSPAALSLFGQVKAVLDPDDVLNPGVLVSPRPVDADLRLGVPMREPASALRLVEDGGSMLAAVHRCTGVGRCVADNTGSSRVMCPSYAATGEEKDSTRGRARVLQEMANGRLVRDGWRSPEVHEALDLCLACKGCSNDCPTGVDMATYKAEALHQAYRRRLRPRNHYALGQLPRWARIAAPVAPAANRALRSAVVQRIAKAAAGIDQRRKVPAFATPTLSRWAADRGVVAGGASERPDVVLWVDSFSEYFTTGPGRAAATLLERAGLRVGVVGEKTCCGLTWISTGQLDGARRIVRHTVDVLHPYLDQGIPVVGLEPSCLAALRADLVQLSDDPRARVVADGIRTFAELLESLPGWQPPDLGGTTVVAQPHCHHSSVLGWEADARLLERTGAQVTRLGGCCGLAGNFGVEKGHYDVSAAVAELELLPAVRAAGPDAVVLADGFSCRTQLDDLAGVRALHMAELLLGSSSP